MSNFEEIDLIDRMASAIAGIVRASGKCEPYDLFVEGFTQEEIDKFLPMAFALAAVECDGKQLCLAK